METQQHISQQYNKELESVKSKVLNMGGMVESQVKNAVSALIEQNDELAKKVAESDYKINKIEIEIDENCAQLIAKRQPAAGDLRLIIAIIKVITDLERIGDEAEKIGRHVQKLVSTKDDTGMHAELANLGEKVIAILHDALDALARMDIEQAAKVVETDKQIDEEFNRVSRVLVTHMMEDPRNIKNMLHVTWCARALERIGDHSQNICEYVIYLVKGQDVRHTEFNLDQQ
ncbi:Phosphate transport system regulatory protein PhoU [uncultured Gammaproteobacteria bacterium]|uniref:phosphate signaling complex protein PhoU n=1 Tax=Bathymodiolus heckerae thiotrophic gill symbiont TaxID=1052212 RepID=UPI0010BC4517|nr:phosphate signaling complex protein PhoU [Bathymodiolus heckerae thiotrophic gill symbiont]CAC9959775.1 Phosphate transport system regulatory protein PhoU [uncultured Gammaproteobacteria bacterium]SHN92394.1 Phosphate transport system regulatory protein PhoU [Bathymodiolus heckerae thiotrophic gill symbiont]